jgi:hypothetical protein
VEVTGVKAHPTLGAVFAVLLAAEPAELSSVDRVISQRQSGPGRRLS